MKKLKPKTIEVVEAVTCDRCGVVTQNDDIPTPDSGGIIEISYRCGYGSIFGDGNLVEIDICERCLAECLGDHLRIKEIDDVPF